MLGLRQFGFIGDLKFLDLTNKDYLITIKKKNVQNDVYDHPFTFYHESPSLDEMTYLVATVKDLCPMAFNDP